MATPTENAESGDEPKLENGKGLVPNAKDPELTAPPTSLVPQSNQQNSGPIETAKAENLKTANQK